MPEDNLEGEFVIKDKTVSAENKNMAMNSSSPHFFSSYCYYPKNVAFEDQEENEEIILIIRRHFATNIPWLAGAFLLSIFPFTLFPFIALLSPFPLPSADLQVLILIFFFLGIFGFILLKFTLWYFNVGIVTNLRVRDIDINGLLYKTVSESKLSFVQDVSYDQVGFVRSIFNYGDVFVQTAANISNIEFDRAPRPATIARIINDLLS